MSQTPNTNDDHPMTFAPQRPRPRPRPLSLQRASTCPSFSSSTITIDTTSGGGNSDAGSTSAGYPDDDDSYGSSDDGWRRREPLRDITPTVVNFGLVQVPFLELEQEQAQQRHIGGGVLQGQQEEEEQVYPDALSGFSGGSEMERGDSDVGLPIQTPAVPPTLTNPVNPFDRVDVERGGQAGLPSSYTASPTTVILGARYTNPSPYLPPSPISPTINVDVDRRVPSILRRSVSDVGHQSGATIVGGRTGNNNIADRRRSRRPNPLSFGGLGLRRRASANFSLGNENENVNVVSPSPYSPTTSVPGSPFEIVRSTRGMVSGGVGAGAGTGTGIQMPLTPSWTPRTTPSLLGSVFETMQSERNPFFFNPINDGTPAAAGAAAAAAAVAAPTGLGLVSGGSGSEGRETTKRTRTSLPPVLHRRTSMRF